MLHAVASCMVPGLRRDERVVSGAGEDDVVGDERVVGVELVPVQDVEPQMLARTWR